MSAILSTPLDSPSSCLPPLTAPQTTNSAIASVAMDESLVRDIDRMGIHTGPATPVTSPPVSGGSVSKAIVEVSAEERKKHAELVNSLLEFVNKEFTRRQELRISSHAKARRRESGCDGEERNETDELDDDGDEDDGARDRDATPTPPIPTPYTLRRVVV